MPAPPWRALDAGAALHALREFAAAHAVGAEAPVALAFSGGADSTSLLLAALHLWGPSRVRALHVDHGLQDDAVRFSAHAQALCAQWGVPLQVLAARVSAARGDSVEERAREARYAVLFDAARALGCNWILTAHQADDQVETLLLALLRGAGPKGLAAMPAASARAGLRLGRPLLAVGAGTLRALLDAQRVPYVVDAMNADPAWRRSRIRHELLPLIARLEPGYTRTLARSARLCAQAAAALQAQADADLSDCMDGSGALSLDALRALPRQRLAEVLRAWLVAAGVRSSAAQIDELCRQLAHSAHGAARLRLRVGTRHAVWRDGKRLCCGAQRSL